ncbi:MAG: LruC domain-containing protein [Pseudomonadota bacterium]
MNGHAYSAKHHAVTSTTRNFCLSMLVIGLGLPFTDAAATDPFNNCPSEAFLIQDTTARLYGVNLATGYYALLSDDLGTNSKINALAFSFHDDYLYGWNYQHRTLSRISSDFQSTPLQVANLPNTDFYVGDIAVHENVYYFYKPGRDYGLYKIDLDAQPDNLQAERVVDGSTLNLSIFDIAFHPTNTLAYAVSRSGALYEINAATGSYQTVSNVGETGTFGAAYFDVDGFLYISRNSDGNVFRIDLTVASPAAEFFAHGPSSGNNDGARCAMAPIIDDSATDIDFGDAPESYGSTIGANGARHEIGDATLYLGASVDGESDAYVFPLSDDTADNADDEDGIQFVTGLEIGNPAIIAATASSTGFLNAWVDWNQDGTFDVDEQILAQEYVVAGQSTFSINVPVWAVAGDSWARFRISSTPDVGPTGGVSDGEVEDYPISVLATGVAESIYPSANNWATLAYEDNWPLQGDYDMNDLVVHLRTRELVRDGSVIGLEITGELAAVGGDYHNGFAVRLQDVPAEVLPDSEIRFWINDRLQTDSPLESNSGDVILIVAEDTWDYASPGEGCRFYRTETGCESDVQMEFEIQLSFLDGVAETIFPAPPYDPFLFATPGYDHGYLFGGAPGRSLEIHLPDRTPTERFNLAFLNLGGDQSDPDSQSYYRTGNGMPWALEISDRWNYPLEYMDIAYAYPQFEGFVISAGEDNPTWYVLDNAVIENVFSNEE